MHCRSRFRKRSLKYFAGSLICLSLSLMFLAELAIGTAVQAQGQPTVSQNYQLPNLSKSRQSSTQHAPDEFKPEKLTGIVELPNVPNYTGHAVFVSGLKYPRDRSGMRIGMTVGVREDENEVLEWYKSALKTYRWTVLTANPTDKYVSAAKDKNTFTVRISPSKQPGFRTLVVLSYKFGI